jgi:myosin-18
MSLEQQRKENRRELAQRDEELEDVRCNAQKKVKGKHASMLLNEKDDFKSLMCSSEA